MTPNLVVACDVGEAAAERIQFLRPLTVVLAGGSTPRALYERLAQSDPVLGVDLGGTRLRVAVFDRDGGMLHKEVTRTPPGNPGALVEAMRDTLAVRNPGVGTAVVGVPGRVAYATGEVVRLPNLPAWEGHLSAGALAETLGFPVLLANDADLAALGEHRHGAGRGSADMLYVTSSTGVGAGVILNGRLLCGHWSLAEAGHMIIDRHSGETVERLGSGTALSRLAGEDAARVAAKARAGDAKALAQFRQVADALAIGVVNLVHCFMPERVVIGGGMAHAGDLLLDPIRDRLARCTSSCSASRGDVARAQLGDDAGLRGAHALWHDSTLPPSLHMLPSPTAPPPPPPPGDGHA